MPSSFLLLNAQGQFGNMWQSEHLQMGIGRNGKLLAQLHPCIFLCLGKFGFGRQKAGPNCPKGGPQFGGHFELAMAIDCLTNIGPKDHLLL